MNALFSSILSVFVWFCLVPNMVLAQKQLNEDEIEGSLRPINGHLIWIGERGRGEPILFIPGGPGFSHRRLEPFFRALSSGYRVIFYDPYGRGQSGRKAANVGYSLDDDVQDIEALRLNLKIERMVIVAHSAGCVIAGKYAERHPERISRLVLASGALSSALWRRGPIDAVNRRIQQGDPLLWQKLNEIIAGGRLSSDIQYQALMGQAWEHLNSGGAGAEFASFASRESDWNPEVYFSMLGNDPERTLAGEFQNFDLFPALRSLRIPILLTYGKMDPSFPLELREEISKALPKASFHTFLSSYHSPHRDENAAYLVLLQRFLHETSNQS